MRAGNWYVNETYCDCFLAKDRNRIDRKHDSNLASGR